MAYLFSLLVIFFKSCNNPCLKNIKIILQIGTVFKADEMLLNALVKQIESTKL